MVTPAKAKRGNLKAKEGAVNKNNTLGARTKPLTAQQLVGIKIGQSQHIIYPQRGQSGAIVNKRKRNRRSAAGSGR